jgi:hypothetical protein
VKAPKGYVLRVEAANGEFDYVAVDKFTVERYACGLVAGEKLRLKRRPSVEASDDESPMSDYSIGEVMEVLLGSDLDPGTVLLERANGEMVSWDDDESIFDDFERLYRQ